MKIYVVMICLIKMLFFLFDHKHIHVQTLDQNQDQCKKYSALKW